MSKQYDFYTDSGIANHYANNLMNRYRMEVWEQTCSDIYRVVFSTLADLLKDESTRNPKSKIAAALYDEKGVFKIGAILTYRAPDEDEEEDSGNYYLEMTFDESDIEGIENVFSNHSSPTFDLFAARNMSTICSAVFKEKRWITILFCTAIDTLREFLDTNASEEEDIDVVMRGVFTASVTVKNGIKIMTIVPGEVIKQIVKNDSIL